MLQCVLQSVLQRVSASSGVPSCKRIPWKPSPPGVLQSVLQCVLQCVATRVAMCIALCVAESRAVCVAVCVAGCVVKCVAECVAVCFYLIGRAISVCVSVYVAECVEECVAGCVAVLCTILSSQSPLTCTDIEFKNLHMWKRYAHQGGYVLWAYRMGQLKLRQNYRFALQENGSQTWRRLQIERETAFITQSRRFVMEDWNTLQHTATHCNTLQHTATRCILHNHVDLWCKIAL